MPVFTHLRSFKTVATHVVVGMGAASFWRGAWYVLDDNLFPDNKEASAMASLGLGVAGMAASQGLVARAERSSALLLPRILGRAGPMVARFGAIYSVALSVVLVWRGTWVGWDCLYERYVNHSNYNIKSPATVTVANSTDPGHATMSGVLSHVVAVSLLLGAGLFTSVLAPPAAISVIRDATVKGASNYRHYQGPAQAVMDQFLGRAAGGMTRTSMLGSSRNNTDLLLSATARGLSAARSVTVPARMDQPYTRFQTLAYEKRTLTSKPGL
jgi:hypothetical protein